MESQSENKKKNAGALRCYFIEIVAITSAYLIEVVKGNRTAGYICTGMPAFVAPGDCSDACLF